jgi:hypothetical protein
VIIKMITPVDGLHLGSLFEAKSTVCDKYTDGWVMLIRHPGAPLPNLNVHYRDHNFPFKILLRYYAL